MIKHLKLGQRIIDSKPTKEAIKSSGGDNFAKILYRISSNSYKKPRLAEMHKRICVENFIKNVVPK